VALIALLGLLLLPRRPEDPVQGVAVAAVTPALPGPSPSAHPPAAPKPLATSVAPPVFDTVRLEKEEVCEGEENLVTVHAHTTDGNDAFLHYTVAGEAGSQVPVRVYVGR